MSYQNPFDQQAPYGGYGPQARAAVSPAAGLMTRVYQWMTLGLGITGASALLVSNNETILQLVFGTPLMWVLMLGTIGMSIALTGFAARMSAPVAFAVFFSYAGLMGVALSPIFIIYNLGSIAAAFFATSGTFAGMTLYGYATKKDLSGWGTFLMMGLIGLVVASLVNMIFFGFGGEMLYWLITYVGVILFAALTAYDTQNIKKRLLEANGVVTPQMSIQGATILYMGFINLFIYLLRLFGSRSRD